MAVTLLAGVVSKLTYAPAAALDSVPLWIRVLSIATGVAVFFVARRGLLTGILAGEGVFVLAAWLVGVR